MTNQVDKFFDYDQNTHVEKLQNMYWDNEDFICLTDTEIYNYANLIDATKEGVKLVMEFKLVRDSIKFQLINKDNALVVVSGKLNVVLTDSTQVIYEPYVCSILFRKIDDAWKISYFQQASEIASSPPDN
ncbi:nuclear transport factor 2 family protein [Algoriphagus namhaensis]|uniref:Nuclear transport factor 2 family protein n=1 Tax=Algoriphagus namhaensis TaxID=915353 RepID=A0ABV8AQU8_9BACT